MPQGGLTRRELLRGSLTVAGLGLLTGCGMPFAPSAQPARLHRIGFLVSSTLSATASNIEAFRQGLRDLKLVENQNFALELRSAEGKEEPLPELAAELVGLNVDVILVSSNAAVGAVQRVTSTTPIVFAYASDPVREGLVSSLARPGGNATGLTQEAGEESKKRLQLLKETVPGLSRVAVVWNQVTGGSFRQTEVAAQALGVQVLSLEIQRPEDLEGALAAATDARADGLTVAAAPLFAALAPRIVEFAAKNRLPGMYAQTTFPRAGGLMFYGPSMPANYRRAATFVDKIFKGSKPADLPVEQPTTFEFVINLKTAQALGLTIPPTVMAQTTELIQ